MDDIDVVDRRKKWFVWGMSLVAVSTVPVVIAAFYSFRGSAHAIGLTAIAETIAEVYAMFGLILAFLLPFAGVVFLAKSFAEGHRERALFSIISICWSALLLALTVWVAWVILQKQVPR